MDSSFLETICARKAKKKSTFSREKTGDFPNKFFFNFFFNHTIYGRVKTSTELSNGDVSHTLSDHLTQKSQNIHNIKYNCIVEIFKCQQQLAANSSS